MTLIEVLFFFSFSHNFKGFLIDDNSTPAVSGIEMVLAARSADHQLIQAHSNSDTMLTLLQISAQWYGHTLVPPQINSCCFSS